MGGTLEENISSCRGGTRDHPGVFAGYLDGHVLMRNMVFQ